MLLKHLYSVLLVLDCFFGPLHMKTNVDNQKKEVTKSKRQHEDAEYL